MLFQVLDIERSPLHIQKILHGSAPFLTKSCNIHAFYDMLHCVQHVCPCHEILICLDIGHFQQNGGDKGMP